MDTDNKRSKGVPRVIGAAVLIGLTVAAILWSQNSQQPATERQPASASTDSAPAANEPADSSATTTITFTDNGFSPSVVRVARGTVVTVVNESSSPVEFSSDDHPAHRDNPEMNMARLAPGERGTFTASTPGEHGYHDHIDHSKTGTLVVTE